MKKTLFTILRGRDTLLRDTCHNVVSMGASLLLCAFAAVSCSKAIIDEQPGCPASGEICNVPITLKTGLGAQIDVKNVSGIDENAVKNVWVIQLSADGSQQLAAPQYVTEFISNSGNYTCAPSLEQTPSKVIFLANTGNSTLVPATGNTLASISALSYKVTNEASLVNNGVIPSSGEWNWDGTPTTFRGIQVSLTPVVAKLNLAIGANMPSNFQYKITKLEIINTPPACYYFGTARTAPWPQSSVGSATTLFSQTFNLVTLGGNAVHRNSFYLPPVYNELGSGSVPADKNSKNAPSAFCQAVRVSGVIVANQKPYKFESSCNHVFYLGSDIVNNYTLEPGKSYNVSLTIKGIKNYDARVSTGNSSTTLSDYPLRWSRINNATTSSAPTNPKSLIIAWVYANQINNPGNLTWKSDRLETVTDNYMIDQQAMIYRPKIFFMNKGEYQQPNITGNRSLRDQIQAFLSKYVYENQDTYSGHFPGAEQIMGISVVPYVTKSTSEHWGQLYGSLCRIYLYDDQYSSIERPNTYYHYWYTHQNWAADGGGAWDRVAEKNPPSASGITYNSINQINVKSEARAEYIEIQ